MVVFVSLIVLHAWRMNMHGNGGHYFMCSLYGK